MAGGVFYSDKNTPIKCCYDNFALKNDAEKQKNGETVDSTKV